jgi:hypothetical protein
MTTPRARALFPRVAGRLRGWTGPPGRGPAGLLAGHAWQSAGPSAAGHGLVFGPTLCGDFKSFFNC